MCHLQIRSVRAWLLCLLLAACAEKSPDTKVRLEPQQPGSSAQEDKKKGADNPGGGDVSDGDKIDFPLESLSGYRMVCESYRKPSQNAPFVYIGHAGMSNKGRWTIGRWDVENTGRLPDDLRKLSHVQSRLFAQVGVLKTDMGSEPAADYLVSITEDLDKEQDWKIWTQLPDLTEWRKAPLNRRIGELFQHFQWTAPLSSSVGQPADSWILPDKDKDAWTMFSGRQALQVQASLPADLKPSESRMFNLGGKLFWNIWNGSKMSYAFWDEQAQQVKRQWQEKWALAHQKRFQKTLFVARSQQGNNWLLQDEAGKTLLASGEPPIVRGLSHSRDSKALWLSYSSTRAQSLQVRAADFSVRRNISLPLAGALVSSVEELKGHPGLFMVGLLPKRSTRALTYLLHVDSGSWRGSVGQRHCANPTVFPR